MFKSSYFVLLCWFCWILLTCYLSKKFDINQKETIRRVYLSGFTAIIIISIISILS